MKKIAPVVAAVMMMLWQPISFADSSVDALIQKLEDKGILTNQEGEQVKGEVPQSEKSSQQATFKTLLPDWLNGFKLSGDFRFRVQTNYTKAHLSSAQVDNFHQTRELIRARLNFEDRINDQFKFVVGIATDGGTPRANNYVLGGSSAFKSGITNTDDFGKPQIVLNKAYAVYTPNDMITVMAGKMDNPIYEAGGGTFFWDPDITPEGGAIQLQKKLNDYVTPWAQAVIIDTHDLAPNANVKTDPFMTVLQGGLKGNLTDKVFYKGSFNWYDYNNPSHFTDTNLSLGTNSTVTLVNGSTALKYSFSDILGGSFELGMNDPLVEVLPSFITIPQVTVFGDFAANESNAGNTQNKAYEIGGFIGSPAVSGWGTWKIQSCYKVLERDSWLDVFPDNDFYFGDTDSRGWRTEFDLGLAKNVWFTFTYFDTELFKEFAGSPASLNFKAPNHEFQMDLNMKF